MDVPITLITDQNYSKFENPDWPVHRVVKNSLPFGKGLSMIHVGDYMRVYMMHHHGGGYHDVKPRESGMGWSPFFDLINDDPDVWMVGYQEINETLVACNPKYINKANVSVQHCAELEARYASLVGVCAYIMRPGTNLTKEWLSLIDQSLDELEQAIFANPAPIPRCCSIDTFPVNEMPPCPVPWAHLHGEALHLLEWKYRVHIKQGLPSFDGSKQYRNAT